MLLAAFIAGAAYCGYRAYTLPRNHKNRPGYIGWAVFWGVLGLIALLALLSSAIS